MDDIYFLTNRNRTARGFGKKPARDPEFYRVGTVTAKRISADYRDYDIGNPELAKERAPNNRGRGSKFGSDAVFDTIRRRMREEGRDLIVFIHGYATDWKDSIRGGGQLRDRYRITDSGKEKAPLVLVVSWPSNGQIAPYWPYFRDRADARKSGLAVARGLARMMDFLTQQERMDARTRHEKLRTWMRDNPHSDADMDSLITAKVTQFPDGTPISGLQECGKKIHLVAHSMGTYVLRQAVQIFRDDEKPLLRVFDSIFLMASDEDEDALERPDKLRPLTRLTKAVYVYHARDDRALIISDTTKTNPDRLGHDGPRNIQSLSERIMAVDCSDVSDTAAFTDARHQMSEP